MNALQQEIREVIEPLVAEVAALKVALSQHIASVPTKLLTVAEAAAVLGCGDETIRRKVRTGSLACKRVGNQMRIDPRDLV
jgi:excisionase family DNA binding protein